MKFYMDPEHVAKLKKRADAAADWLRTRLDQRRLSELASEPSTGKCEAIELASTLEGVVLSSDTDCEFFPCVFGPTDGEHLSFENLGVAIGIPPERKAEHIDGDAFELRIGDADDPFIAKLLGLDEDELEEVDEYLTAENQARCARGGALLSDYETRSAVIIADVIMSLRFVLAQHPSGTMFGVVAARVDT